MTPLISISVVLVYIGLLALVSKFTTSSGSNEEFFTAGRSSHWALVAFGMIGASLSGVTFVSVPGEVKNSSMHYFQMVLGYFFGYLVISKVLLPVYYKQKIVSIYEYLNDRFGHSSYRSGAVIFLISRLIGASFRLFLVASVLQLTIFDAYGIPFWVSTFLSIAFIWVYTSKGGIKTIVWTDTLQTLFMLLSFIITAIILISQLDEMHTSTPSLISTSKLTKVFDFEWGNPKSFWTYFTSGIFITIVMTGLDQDMMQKNLTCRDLSSAQKNMWWFSIALVFVNLFILYLGVLLNEYASLMNISVARTDMLFPTIAISKLGVFGGIVFLLGITAAAYSSADSALTSMTTSFCVDFLGFDIDNGAKNQRYWVHIMFSIMLFVTILLFNVLADQSVVVALFKAAGYTYGPLLGLFGFGIFTTWQVRDRLVPWVCVLSPLMSYLLNQYSELLLNGYRFGFEILMVNGVFTFIGLMLIRSKKSGPIR